MRGSLLSLSLHLVAARVAWGVDPSPPKGYGSGAAALSLELPPAPINAHRDDFVHVAFGTPGAPLGRPPALGEPAGFAFVFSR